MNRTYLFSTRSSSTFFAVNVYKEGLEIDYENNEPHKFVPWNVSSGHINLESYMQDLRRCPERRGFIDEYELNKAIEEMLSD